MTFGEVVVNQTNYQGCQFDVHLIQCQTPTSILEIVNAFIRSICSELFPICIHTHLTHLSAKNVS